MGICCLLRQQTTSRYLILRTIFNSNIKWPRSNYTWSFIWPEPYLFFDFLQRFSDKILTSVTSFPVWGKNSKHMDVSAHMDAECSHCTMINVHENSENVKFWLYMTNSDFFLTVWHKKSDSDFYRKNRPQWEHCNPSQLNMAVKSK